MSRPSPSTSPGGSPEDRGLLERVAQGDSAALKVLYERYGARTLGVAVRVLGAHAESEEVVQETFLEVWKRAREFDDARGSASAWIATIARSRAIDRLRARGATARKLAAIGDEPPAEAAPSPLEDVEQRLDRQRINAALDELPVEQRQPIELAYFEGLTHREIAERFAEPLGTIKTRVRLGLEKLGAILKRPRA